MKDMDVEEIQRRARSGPLFLLTRRGAAVLIGLLTTITTARLLSPRDFGLATMATVAIGFTYVLRDFGLTNAMLRKGMIEEREINFLFWFNVASTLTIAAVIAICSPLIAHFYGEPLVRDILLFALIGFIISGCSMQHNALLKRNLRFGMVAMVETLSQLAGFVVTVVLALLWRNYWAIVAGLLAQSCTTAVINISATRWKPGKPQIIPEAGELLRFGANSTLYSIVNFASRYASTIIIGRWLGPVSLGHYNRAYNLYLLPMNNLLQPIVQATLPVMARLRPHPELYRETYLGLVRRLCVTLVPASVGLTFTGPALVSVLLGAKWYETGLALSALAPGLAVYGAIWPISDLLISQSRAAELRRIGFSDLVVRLVGTLIGVQFGLIGAALGYTVATCMMLPIRLQLAGRKGPVSSLDQWRALLPSVPVGVGTAAGCAIAMAFVHAYTAREIIVLVVVSVGGVVGAAMAGALFASSRRAIMDTIATVTGRHRVAGA